jgi:hypothetical protein
MLSILLAQWSSALENANRLSTDFMSGSLAPLDAALGRGNKELAGQALKVYTDYTLSRGARVDSLWRSQRERLDLSGSARSLRSMQGICADLLARSHEAATKYVAVSTEAFAAHLESMSTARNANDIGLSAVEFSMALQAALRTMMTDIAGTASGVGPAWTQWLQRSVEEHEPSRSETASNPRDEVRS